MENQSDKNDRNRRKYKLQKNIGMAFQTLRKGAGYSSSEKFANAKDLNRGMYGRYEAGSVDMKVSTLLDTAIAHGLTEEDVFNKEFLNLGLGKAENTLLEKSKSTITDQVRHQVELLSGIDATKNFDNDDIADIEKILTTGLSPSSKQQLIKKIKLKSKTVRFNKIMDFLKESNFIEMTDPDHPNNPKQKYYTTESGKAVLRGSAKD